VVIILHFPKLQGTESRGSVRKEQNSPKSTTGEN
jgi:hypothetical protein